VTNLPAWKTFATDILGFQSNGTSGNDSLLLRIDEYAYRLMLQTGDEDDVAFVGWEVPDRPALNALAEVLERAGVKVSRASDREASSRKVESFIRFSDPTGLTLEAFYGPLALYNLPFQSPSGVSGFVTGELGMGHIVIAVSDFAQSLHFYTELLGMRETDYFHVGAPDGSVRPIAFLHCNRRHHSLAFSEAREGKRLRHIMFQVNSLDDVGRTYYRCQDMGVELAGSLGRHSNDHMVSFYVRTPSGFDLEYGWGAREIDDQTWHVQTHADPSMWGHRGRYQRKDENLKAR
jgi:2,3-dihydroxybiphenyl 1,2-dioxygenase